MISNYLLNIFICSTLLLISNVFSRRMKCQYNPSTVLCFFWFLYIFIPLILNPNKELNSIALIYVVLSLVTFTLSTFLFPWSSIVSKDTIIIFQYKKLKKILFLTFSVGLICSFIDLRLQGLKIYDLFFNFFEVSSSYISKRYSGNIQENIFSSLANILSYVSSIIGGLVYFHSKHFKYIILGIFPTVLITLIKASKGAVLLSIIMFIAAYGTQKIIFKQNQFLSRKSIKPILFYLSITLTILIIAFISKGGKDLKGQELFEYVASYLQRYSSGHIYAFSDWFQSTILEIKTNISYERNSYLPGFLTFMSIFQILGDTSFVPPGVYTEYFYDGSLTSNIYTIFRGLITDFGILGSLIFWFIFGSLSNYIYYNIRSRNYSSISVSAYPLLIGYIYTSFIISLLIWKSTIIAFLLSAAILEFTKQKRII